jgi:hypothetical protein
VTSKNIQYLKLVESIRDRGTTRQRVIANPGRLDGLQASGQLVRLGQRLLALEQFYRCLDEVAGPNPGLSAIFFAGGVTCKMDRLLKIFFLTCKPLLDSFYVKHTYDLNCKHSLLHQIFINKNFFIENFSHEFP